jgi:hypothetical protein
MDSDLTHSVIGHHLYRIGTHRLTGGAYSAVIKGDYPEMLLKSRDLIFPAIEGRAQAHDHD